MVELNLAVSHGSKIRAEGVGRGGGRLRLDVKDDETFLGVYCEKLLLGKKERRRG
jgi:hypothetical protein